MSAKPTILTAGQFEAIVKNEPGWAARLDYPVKVRGEVRLENSPITHLSPWLEFGHDHQLWEGSENKTPEPPVAVFDQCPKLKAATGTFRGMVHFKACGIETIDTDGLLITRTDKKGWAANFQDCQNLKVATGNFPGKVRFSNCPIEIVRNFCIPKAKGMGESTKGGLFIAQPSPENDGTSIIAPIRAFFPECTKLRECPDELLECPGVIMDMALKKRLLEKNKKAREAAQILKAANSKTFEV